MHLTHDDLLSRQTEEDRPTFRPFTRESLAQIEARIQEEEEKKRELEKKRQEGEVRLLRRGNPTKEWGAYSTRLHFFSAKKKRDHFLDPVCSVPSSSNLTS